MGGVYREIVPPERMVHTELFDEDWTGGQTLATSVFTEQGGKTNAHDHDAVLVAGDSRRGFQVRHGSRSWRRLRQAG